MSGELNVSPGNATPHDTGQSGAHFGNSVGQAVSRRKTVGAKRRPRFGPRVSMSVNSDSFADDFFRITGHRPMRWQRRLFDRFIDGKIPAALDLPTGLGKT